MDRDLFDDQLLQDYMNGFYGYGNYSGDYWFIGMEEGAAGTFQDIVVRLQAWDSRGRKEVEDLVEYHDATGSSGLFVSGAPIQRTWGGLIKVMLSAQGQSVDRENVRRLQQNGLGRKDGNNALLELLPLPSRSIGDWIYANHSQLPQLTRRVNYMKYYAPQRAEALRQRIEQYKPKVIVFYSSNGWYRYWWEQIAAVSFIYQQEDEIYVARNASTTFVITKHPVAHGRTTAYWEKVGMLIALDRR